MRRVKGMASIACLALAGLAAWATGSGCQGGMKTYASAQPPFVVHYPGAWSQTVAPGPTGPMQVFSPDAQPDLESPRVTLTVAAAQVRAKVLGDTRKPAVLIEQSLDQEENGLKGHRWFVTLAPLAVIVEAYGPAGKFEKIKAVGSRMAGDILRQAAEAGGGG